MSSGAIAVGQVLALAGLLFGVVTGALAGWRASPGFGPAFGLYLGAVCMAASNWAGSLEIVPLALLAGAVWGIAPFAAAFLLLRRIVRRARQVG